MEIAPPALLAYSCSYLAYRPNRIGTVLAVNRLEFMKKIITCLFSLVFVFGLSAFAQDSAAPQAQTDTDSKPQLMTLKGTVNADNGKYTFVNDADGKSWDVKNPAKLKGHEGHHVQLSAHVYPDQNAIHVMSVKMLKADTAAPPAQ